MKLAIVFTLSIFLMACRPDATPTSYTVTIKPQSGPDKTIQTPMNTPVSFTYSLQTDREEVTPTVKIAKQPQFGKIYSCVTEQKSIRCVYEPNANFVGTDKIEFVTVDGDFKSDKNGTMNIIVTFVPGGEITIPGDDLPEDFQEQIDNANTTCTEAISKGTLQTITRSISFPAAIECDFNEEGTSASQLNAVGNGPRQDGKVRARREQYSDLRLDQPGILCDLDFSFPSQTMQYDDEIFLLLNNYVLMASTNYSDQSGESRYAGGLKTNSIGFQTYKWLGENSLYNLHYAHAVTPKYCLGLNSSTPNYNERCNIPKTENEGQLKLDIPESHIINLGLASQLNYPQEANPLFRFGFVTTGDNDNGDCEHSEYSFSVTIKYAPKN